jgi:hypothetical protein
MVSLVAGVMVSLAVVGLARSSTNAFHEQARIAGVEASLRIASERLRADLTRAGFLSTPNIQLDPRVAHGGAADPNFAMPFLNPAGPALANLQSIRIGVGGSQPTTNVNNLDGLNGLNPDDIILGGDFTTDAQFFMHLSESGGARGSRLFFDTTPGMTQDANAFMFLRPAALADTIMKNAFMPGGIPNFFRLADPCGYLHFGVVAATGYAGPIGFVDPDTTASPAPGYGFIGQQSGTQACADPHQRQFDMIVAPVQRVRWFLGPETNPRIDSDPALGDVKFNLYRQMLDVNGGANAALPPEIIAEYAIDMKFGITVQAPDTQALTIVDMDNDNGIGGLPPKGPATAAVSGTGITHDVSTLTNLMGAKYNTLGPQNVKSVRFRVSLRTPIADRSFSLLPAGGAGSRYLIRYCANAACTQYARVRTLVSEVALTNQNQPMFCSSLGFNANNCP